MDPSLRLLKARERIARLLRPRSFLWRSLQANKIQLRLHNDLYGECNASTKISCPARPKQRAGTGLAPPDLNIYGAPATCISSEVITTSRYMFNTLSDSSSTDSTYALHLLAPTASSPPAKMAGWRQIRSNGVYRHVVAIFQLPAEVAQAIVGCIECP